MTKIALIGDSHMQALGPRLKRLYEQDDPSVEVTGTAHPGWSLVKFINEAHLSNLARGMDLVVFEIGGNDQITDRETYKARLATAVGMLRSTANPGAKVVIVGPPTADALEVDTRHRATTLHQASVWREAGADQWIDSRGVTANLPMRDDDVHFAVEGYDRWAAWLHNRIGKPSGGYGWIAGIAALGIAGWVFWRTAK